MDPRIVYCTPFFVAAAFIFAVALFSFNRRGVRGGWYVTNVCLAASVWALTEGLLYVGLDLRTCLHITYIQYLGIAPLPPLALFFVLTIFGYTGWTNRKQVALLLGIALFIILLVWTNPWHEKVFTDVYEIVSGPFPMLGLDHGGLWWLIIGYHYLLLALISILLVRQMLTSSGFQSSQAGVILVAVSVVWIVNAVYISGNSPVPNMDISPLAFVLVALSISWGFFRYNLLDITPIARSEIFSGQRDPILVLDHKDRIVDINPAAAALFDIPADESVGREITRVLGGHPQLLDLPVEADSVEACLTLADRERFFDLHIVRLADRRGGKLGRLIVMHDTTEKKFAAETMAASEKLKGVFEMAGAICHELNQPLMAISGYAELLAMKLKEGDPLYKDVRKISKQVERMGEITHKLMRITKYETKEYLDRKIIDIEKSSIKPAPGYKPNGED